MKSEALKTKPCPLIDEHVRLVLQNCRGVLNNVGTHDVIAMVPLLAVRTHVRDVAPAAKDALVLDNGAQRVRYSIVDWKDHRILDDSPGLSIPESLAIECAYARS